MVIDASIVKRHIKPKADSTLLNMKKADLIDYVRTLEHNYNVAVSFNEQQARNIEAMIRNGDIPQHWISVEDRLPDTIDDYIVAIKHKYDHEEEYSYGKDVAVYNPYEGAYIDGCWDTFNDWDEGQQFLHVTHWMPLPQLPEEPKP